MSAALCLSACGEVVSVDNGKLHVVTTTAMVADIVENVGGDNVVVESLMGSGVDPHLYTPTASDISALENADVIFYNGFHLEGKMIEIFDAFEEDGRDIFAITRALPIDDVIVNESYPGAADPHIWFDVDLWIDATDYVGERLSEVDKANETSYVENLAEYKQELEELKLWVYEQIDTLPEDQRVLITAHDAFSYFGAAYGFEVLGIQGVSTDSDYSLQDLEQLIDLILERNIKAIFVETSVSSKSVEALQAGVEAEGAELKIGGSLYSDAMGEYGTEKGTYIGMFRHNVSTIVNALK